MTTNNSSRLVIRVNYVKIKLRATIKIVLSIGDQK